MQLLTIKNLNLAGNIFLVFLIITPLFLHLDSLPVRIWDEARLAANALEMHQNSNYIVTHFDGKPDMWNTKPPLMIWAQVIFIKLFGVNELALRMPSALAALFTCMLLVLFSKKTLNNYWLGLISSLVLVTTNGYVEDHVSRSGDYDALLTLFTTGYCLSIFHHIEKGENKYLHLFFVSLTLAVLTKSVQGLFFLPVVGFYLILRKKHLQLFQNKWLYIDAALFLFFVAGYFMLRDWMNPGYLQAVWENDLGGRFSNDLVEGNRNNWYYIVNLVNLDFTYWLAFAFIGYSLALKSKDKLTRSFFLYNLLLASFYLLVISMAKTKLPWYSAPLYPLLSIAAAIALQRLFTFVKDRYKIYPQNTLVPFLFLSALFLYPYQHIFRKTFRPSEHPWNVPYYHISNYLQAAALQTYSVANQRICYEDYNTHILFYVNTLKAKGQHISFIPFQQIQKGDTVIAAEPKVLARIQKTFDYQILRKKNNLTVYKILDSKPTENMNLALSN